MLLRRSGWAYLRWRLRYASPVVRSHVCRFGPSNFKVVHASADSPDSAVRNLFWACCGGGGGNFGAIALTFSNESIEDFAAAHDRVVAHRRDELSALGAVEAPLGPIIGHPVWIDAPDDQVVNGSGPNRRGKYKSAYMKQVFPVEQIDVLWNMAA